jgi:thymidylate synthase (FAD)
LKYKTPQVYLLQASPLFVSEVAARICYNSFEASEHDSIRNFKQTHTVPEKDIEDSTLLEKLCWAYQHESILEHTILSFYVCQLSREVLQEVSRHRIGMPISVKSTRYTIENLVNTYLHFRDTGDIQPILKEVEDNIIVKDGKWVEIETQTIIEKLDMYHNEKPLEKNLKGHDKKKQNDRIKRCLPETWMTECVLSFNLRSLKHFIKLRNNSGSAYYGIVELARQILEKTPSSHRKFIIKEN